MQQPTNGHGQDQPSLASASLTADRWLLRMRGPVQVEVVDQQGRRVGPYPEREEDESRRHHSWQGRTLKLQREQGRPTRQPQELPHLFEVSIPGASYQPGHNFTTVMLTQPGVYTCRCRASAPCAVDVYWSAFQAESMLQTIHYQGIPLNQHRRAQWAFNTSETYAPTAAAVRPMMTLEEDGRTQEIPPTAILDPHESRDILAPKTTISLEDGKVVIIATDDPGGSGVLRTYYTTDGRTFSVYQEPFPLPSEAKIVMAFSVDRNGNREYPGAILPVLGLSETHLTFTATAGEQKVGPHTVHVSNLDPLSVTGPLAWTASTDVPWLSIEKTEGQTPDQLTFSVDPGNLGPGTHRGNVIVRSSTPGVVYAERVIPVVLEVKPR